MTIILVGPGDYLSVRTPDDRLRYYRVESVLLGASWQESVVALRVVDRDPATDEFGLRIGTMYVPTDLIEAAGATVVADPTSGKART